MLKIGLIKEGKIPSDYRVALTPEQAYALMKKYSELEIIVQSSEKRAFTDDEYRELGIKVTDDVSDCDILMGIKEVPVDMLIPGKTYLFFSHTIKKQPHNRKLLQEILNRNIRLIDYELLADENKVRLIGFGRFAGIVGAHYALMMWGLKKNYYNIKPAWQVHDYARLIEQYHSLYFGKPKILVTGGGRVSKGIVEILNNAGIREVSVDSYLNEEFHEAVYVQCDMDALYVPLNDKPFSFQEFFDYPERFECVFRKFIPQTDILINGMYWSPRAQRLFEKEEARKENFRIQIIADVTCDINGSVPLTYFPTTSIKPFYGIDRDTLEVTVPFGFNTIDMMTIDNLPNELPRDASHMFGEVLSTTIIPLLINEPENPILKRATIAENGQLTPDFNFLKDYVYES